MAVNIEVKVYKGNNIIVEAYKTASFYNLRIFTLRNHITATRIHGEYGNESWWDETVEKFETKEMANRYFKGIQKNNPDMKYVCTENRQLQFGKVSYKPIDNCCS